MISFNKVIPCNSLYGETPDPEEWVCPVCEENLMGLPTELLCHHVLCKRKKDLGTAIYVI